MNKLFFVTLSYLLLRGMAYGADPSCEAQAGEKKLAGAAKNSS
jgi:hypothetical protein